MSKQEVTSYFRSFVDEFTNEIVVMSSLKGYTNIVSYEDHMVIPHENGIGADILIRMELLTPLSKWFIQNEMSEADVIKLGCDICQALSLCHKNKIIHRDIKPENIFVNKNGDFKLKTFGSVGLIDKLGQQRGACFYMAPEVVKNNYYSEMSEVYSLGILLYKFLNNNCMPFLMQRIMSVQDLNRAMERRMSGEKIPVPINGNPKLKCAVLMCLEYEVHKRVQNVEVLQKILEQCK